MNYPFVFRQLGLLLVVMALVMFVIAVGDLIHLRKVGPSERSAIEALVIASCAGFLIGGVAWFGTRRSGGSLGRREALLLVSLSWFIGAGLSGLPYFLWSHLDPSVDPLHEFRSPVDCYFEAMSGLTTTGATILTEISEIPKSLLLWRSFTHWLGGLGIVLLFVAVLPSLGVGGKKLYRVEAPGPSPEGVRPHIRETARVLWMIYFVLTVLQILALRAAGMGWYDSVCHTFGTLATGGFSPLNGSVGELRSTPVNWIIIFFMILAGGNFGLYHQVIAGKVKGVWRDPELRFYLLVLLTGSVAVTVSLLGRTIVLTTGEQIPPSLGAALTHGLFTTVSIQTTTGFCTADFNQWPTFSKGILVVLMFIGGCAGSTAGGVKVIRLWVALRVMVSELERSFRPNVIRPIRIGNTAIDSDYKIASLAYVLGILLLFVLGTGAIVLLEPESSNCSIVTAATASVATLCTIGPGLDQVGAVANYGWFTPSSKAVLITLMAMGRLEIFAVAVLFVPRFWRGT